MQLASGVVPVPYPPISFRSYERYVDRFGPSFHVACARAALCCFDDDTNCLHPWFHGTIPRSKGDDLIKNAELGSFLVRFSEAKPKCMTLVYRGRAGGKNIIIFNLGTCFGLTDRPSPLSRNASSPKSPSSSSETFETISDFLERHSKLKFPISSRLHMICLDEMETEEVNEVIPKTISPQKGPSPGFDDNDDSPDVANSETLQGYLNIPVPARSGSAHPPPTSKGESGRGAKRRANNVSVGNKKLPRSYLRTRRNSSLTTAIILITYPNSHRRRRPKLGHAIGPPIAPNVADLPAPFHYDRAALFSNLRAHVALCANAHPGPRR